jgi:hypothetical protein
MHNAEITKCSTVATRAAAGQNLYAIAGLCDGSQHYNFNTSQLDGSYSDPSRANYSSALLTEETGTPLSGDESWYSIDLPALPGCMCYSVFIRAGGAPAASDTLVASGSLGC